MKPEYIIVFKRSRHWSPIVGQMNPVHTVALYFFKISFSTVLQYECKPYFFSRSRQLKMIRNSREQMYFKRASNSGLYLSKAPRPFEPQDYLLKSTYLNPTNYYTTTCPFAPAKCLPRMQCLEWGEMSSR